MSENTKEQDLEKVADTFKSLSNFSLWLYLTKSTVKDIRKNKINYCLGFSACFLVVSIVAILVTLLSKSPLIFLRLAELRGGEMDATIESGGSWNGFHFMNYTEVKSSILNKEPYVYHTARKEEGCRVYPAKKCSNLDPDVTSWKYLPYDPTDYCGFVPGQTTCFEKHCTRTSFDTTIFFVDSEQEKKILLGREWSLPILKKGECHIHNSIARALGINIGDLVYITFNPASLLGPIAWKEISGVASAQEPQIYVPFKISGVYDNPKGKHKNNIYSSIFIEYDELMSHLASHLDTSVFTPEGIQNVSNVDLKQYAKTIIVNFPPPRINAYLDNNYDIIQKQVIKFINEPFYKLGFTQILTDLPILTNLKDTKIISIFLGLILNIIIFILLFLSILLIYSLLMINVETRTFDLGVMRMVGTTRRGIIMLLLVQAFSYSIPAWIIGLLMAQLATYGISTFIVSLLGIELDASIDGMGVLWSTLLGLLVPIVSAILPIRNALGQNLHDSLDTRASKTSAVKVKLERSNPTEAISLPLVLVGFLLALFGALVYYGLPLGLLQMNLGALLNFFFFLLIGMLLGLTMLSLNLQRLVERFVLKVFFFWENRALQKIVSKNLVAHKVRNRKTTIMYAISLGFIIFVSVAYSIQIATFSYRQQQQRGCFLMIRSENLDSETGGRTSLNSKRAQLEEFANKDPRIVDYAWITQELKDGLMDANDLYISHIGGIYSSRQRVYAVTPNIFDATITQFLHVYESNVDASNLGRYLYSKEGDGGALISSLYQDKLGLTLENDFLLGIEYRLPSEETYSHNYRLKALAFLDSSPSFTISPFPAIFTQDLIVSFPTYFQLTGGRYESIEDLPLRDFIIKLADNRTEYETDNLKQILKDMTIDVGGANVWDYRDSVSPFETATVAMTYFFNFTTIIAMLISFFSLMSSMFTNVYEQTKEIAILRALGVSKLWMYKIYIYEAFVLVVSSSLLGIMIGVIVSYTMTLQQVLFTQLPIPFVFPWTILIVVFACSIVFSFLASFSPIFRVMQKRIVQIFRMVS